MKNVLMLVALAFSAVSSVSFAGYCGDNYCQPGYECIQSRCLPGDPCYFAPYCKYVGNGGGTSSADAVCRATSGGYGYAVSTAQGGSDICNRLGYYGAGYYGGRYTGTVYYVCCYDPYGR